jgi:uncharacterized membrane protein
VTGVSMTRTSPDTPETADQGPLLERTTLFTDAVVAIAITLLALDLPVPHGQTNGELWRSATEAGPEYRSFLISFAVIWVHWAAHRQTFRAVRGLDRFLSTLNGLWLLMVVLAPFAMKVLAGNGAFQLRFGFYALLQTLASGMLALMAWHVRRAGLHHEDTAPGRLAGTVARTGAVAACFAVSIPVALAGQWAYLCWIAAPLAAILVRRSSRPGRVRR